MDHEFYNQFMSLPRMAEDAESDALLDEHFTQQWDDLNARWDEVA